MSEQDFNNFMKNARDLKKRMKNQRLQSRGLNKKLPSATQNSSSFFNRKSSMGVRRKFETKLQGERNTDDYSLNMTYGEGGSRKNSRRKLQANQETGMRHSYGQRTSIERLKSSIDIMRRERFRNTNTPSDYESVLRDNFNLKLKLENIDLELKREKRMMGIDFEYRLGQAEREKKVVEEKLKNAVESENMLQNNVKDLERRLREMKEKYNNCRDSYSFVDNKLNQYEYDNKRLKAELAELENINAFLKEQNNELIGISISKDEVNERYSKRRLTDAYNAKSEKLIIPLETEEHVRKTGRFDFKIIQECVSEIKNLLDNDEISRNTEFRLSSVADRLNKLVDFNSEQFDKKVEEILNGLENQLSHLYTLLRTKINIGIETFNEINDKLGKLQGFKSELQELFDVLANKDSSDNSENQYHMLNEHQEMNNVLNNILSYIYEEEFKDFNEDDLVIQNLKLIKKLETLLTQPNDIPDMVKVEGDIAEGNVKIKINTEKVINKTERNGEKNKDLIYPNSQERSKSEMGHTFMPFTIDPGDYNTANLIHIGTQKDIESASKSVQCDITESNMQELVEKNSSLINKVKELKNSLSLLDKEKQELNKTVESQNSRINDLIVNLDNKVKIINEMKKAIEEKSVAVTDLENEQNSQSLRMKEYENILTQKMEELEDFKQNVLSTEIDKISQTYDQNIKAYQQQIDELNDVISNLEAKLISVNGEAQDNANQNTDGGEGGETRNITINMKTNELMINNSKIPFQHTNIMNFKSLIEENKIKNLRKSQSENYISHIIEDNVLEEDGAELEVEIHTFIKELLESHRDQVSRLEYAFEELKEKYNGTVDNFNDLKIKYQKLKIENHSLTKLKTENSLLEDKLAQKSLSLTGLDFKSDNKVVKDEENDIDPEEINKKNMELIEENLELADQVDETQRENEELKNKLEEYKNDIKDIQEQLKRGETKEGDNTEAVATKHSLVEEYKAQIKNLNLVIADKNTQITKLENFNSLLKADLDNLNSFIESQKSKGLMDKDTQEFNNLNEKVEKLNGYVEEKNKIIEEYEKEIENLQDILNDFNEERNDYLDRLERMSELNNALRIGSNSYQEQEPVTMPVDK